MNMTNIPNRATYGNEKLPMFNKGELESKTKPMTAEAHAFKRRKLTL